MKTKNNDIQLFKFVYSCVIVLYHLASNTAIHFKGGYCGVEYFLLTAGLFLFLSFERGEELGRQRTPGQYLAKRFCRFFPWSFTAFLFSVFVRRVLISPTTSIVAWVDYFASDIWEILMVKWNGMNNNVHLLNGPAWTLSAMLIVGFLIWSFLYYYKKHFVNLILPITLLLGFGYWMHLPSADTEKWIGFTTFGTFRTWLIFCLSAYCVPIGKKLAKIPFNKAGKILLTVAEVLIHAFALVVMIARAERYYQWLLTLLFMISIAIAMSGHSYIAKVLENVKLVDWLGDLSMSVYLVHTPVIWLFRHYYDTQSWAYRELLPVFVAVLGTAVIHYCVTKWVIKSASKLWPVIKVKLTV